MQQLYDVLFASSNKHKYLEAKKILGNFGLKLGFLKCSLEEIQSDSIKKIAEKKAVNAYNQCKKPVIVEDDGLFIEALNGFPGPFSSYVFKTVGNEGILKMLSTNRHAKFVSVISYYDKKNGLVMFEANVQGKISKKIFGKGWGYDPIFTLKGESKTFAQLYNKNQLSHRYKALKKFSIWFMRMQKSNGR